ncbi:hypothetical protein ACHAXT_001963 [Thalassiosira profunda]
MATDDDSTAGSERPDGARMVDLPIDDDAAPLPPIQAAAAYEAEEKVLKLSASDDDDAPLPPLQVAAAAEELERSCKHKKAAWGVETVGDGAATPPEPAAEALLHEREAKLRRLQRAVATLASRTRPVPVNRGEGMQGQMASAVPRPNPSGDDGDDEESPSSEGHVNLPESAHGMSAVVSSSHESNDDATLLIPEAFLVPEGGDEVVVGTLLEPALPWWKMRLTRRLLALVLLLMAIFAVALGVTLSQESSSMVQNASPTARPTAVPTASAAPSASPSSCADTILSDARQVDFGLDAPVHPRVAVDGSSMVAAVRDTETSIVSTIFYSLTSDGEWVMQNSFQQPFSGFGYSSVAISGKSAFVAVFELVGGTLAVYEQDDLGEWAEVEDPIDETAFDGFAWYVDVDGNLACIGDIYGHIYLFRQVENEWAPIGNTEGSGCSVHGETNTLVVAGYPGYKSGGIAAVLEIQQAGIASSFEGWVRFYAYDEELSGLVQIQDSISADANSGDTSQEYFAYSDWRDGDFFVYRRDKSNETFSFHQRLNVSVSDNAFALDVLSLDKSLLAVRGVDGTHIFSEQNGFWEEIIALDEPYDSVHLSGDRLLATKGPELYSFDIGGCVPSTSIAAPSCDWVEIMVVYDRWPHNHETSWDLRRIDASGDLIEVGSHSTEPSDANSKEPFQRESLCLEDGQYEFTIYDMGGNGMESGHYNVTTSDGTLIVEGARFAREEATSFAIPFVPVPPAVETVMSSSNVPSMSPSNSSDEEI